MENISKLQDIEAKLKQYINMDHELSFDEFNEYYTEIIEELNNNYQLYGENELLPMRYVLNTVSVNARNWSYRKNKYSKKYKKIDDKASFWADAITYKLKKDLDYTDDQIQSFEEEYDAKIRPAEVEE